MSWVVSCYKHRNYASVYMWLLCLMLFNIIQTEWMYHIKWLVTSYNEIGKIKDLVLLINLLYNSYFLAVNQISYLSKYLVQSWFILAFFPSMCGSRGLLKLFLTATKTLKYSILYNMCKLNLRLYNPEKKSCF